MEKLLTIAIPIFNGASTIAETLNSIISQIDKTKFIEVLICDNNSTDNSGSICKKYAEQYSFIRYNLNEQNIGFDSNIERLIDLSVSNYIWFVGADDEISSGGIEYVLNIIQKDQNYAGIVVNYALVDRVKNKFLNKNYIKLYTDIEFKNANIFLETLGITPNFLSSVIINKKYYKKDILSKYIGSNWYHIYTLFITIENQKSFFISIPFVLNKGIYLDGPNSANAGGVSVKILLDLLDFIDNLNPTYYYDYSRKKVINQSIKYFFRKIPSARMHGLKFEKTLFNRLFQKYMYRPELYFIILPLIILPQRFYKIVYVVRNFLFKIL